MGYRLLKLGKRKCLMLSFYTQCRDAIDHVSTICHIVKNAETFHETSLQGDYSKLMSSTSKINVAPPGIMPPAPCSP